MTIDGRKVEMLARHECGHYIVGLANGFRMGCCQIKLGSNGARDGQSEIYPFEPLRTREELEAFVRRRIEVLYAGCLAEAVLNGKVVESVFWTCIRMAANQDHAKARELLYVLANFCAPERATEEERKTFANHLDLEVINTAEQKVLANFDRIDAMAKDLGSRLKNLNVWAKMEEGDIRAQSYSKF